MSEITYPVLSIYVKIVLVFSRIVDVYSDYFRHVEK